MQKNVVINARKYNGEIHRSWHCDLLESDGSLLVFIGEFKEKILHSDLGIIRPGTISYEYYWLDRWYNIFRFHEPEGTLRNFYCNVNAPPIFESNILNYIDLDLDVLVSNQFDVRVLDADEFELNSKIYGYPKKIKQQAETALQELLELIEHRHFPFNISHL